MEQLTYFQHYQPNFSITHPVNWVMLNKETVLQFQDCLTEHWTPFLIDKFKI